MRSILSPLTKGLSAIVASLMLLTGCGDTAVTSTTSSGIAAPIPGVPAVAAEKCRLVEQIMVPAGTPRLIIVVDHTASAAPLGLPDTVTTTLASAQHDGLAMQIIGVNGPSAKPIVIEPFALDPKPGNDSTTANEARQIGLACALQKLTDAAIAAPTVEGSDPLAAVLTALDQNPSQTVVISDGAPSGGILATAWGSEDPEAVQMIAHDYDIPTRPGKTITWIHLGLTEPPLAGWATGQLEQLYTQILAGTTITFDTHTGATIADNPNATPGLPDPITLPQITTHTAGQVTCVAVPSTLLFQPDQATLTTPDALTGLITILRDALAQHPTWPVHVGGHTADFGTADGRRRLSTARAETIIHALKTAGISNTLIPHGYGSTYPATPEYTPDGHHNLAAATSNRRVTITYGPTSTASPTC